MNISDDGFSLTYWEENYRRESRIFLKTILDPFPRKKEKLKGIKISFFFIFVVFLPKAGVMRKLDYTSNFNFTWKTRNYFYLSQVCTHCTLYMFYICLGWTILIIFWNIFAFFPYPASLYRFVVDYFEIFECYLLFIKTLSIAQSNLV